MSKLESDLRLAHSVIREMSSSMASTVVLLEACGLTLVQERLLLSRAERLAPSADPIVRAVNTARPLLGVAA